jgi:hypothetical protein
MTPRDAPSSKQSPRSQQSHRQVTPSQKYNSNNGAPGSPGFQYHNGDFYKGQWKDKMRHGNGVFHSVNGDIYAGEWYNDVESGHGILKYSNGSIYDGGWLQGKPHGYGILKSNKNSIYQGEFYKGTMQGQGSMQFPNGDFYQGSWKKGKKHGNGHITYSTNNSLTSTIIKQDQRNIRKSINTNFDGVWRNTCGSIGSKTIYTGQFKNNVRHGQGILKYPNGDVYDGMWKNNQMYGNGILTYANGDYFSGEFVDGKINGHGILKYKNNNVYNGEFLNNLPHGRGKYKTNVNNKCIYNGFWEYGKMTGKCVFKKESGFDKLKGCLMISPNKNDMNCKSFFWNQNDGGSFKGEFSNGNPVGMGCFKQDGGIEFVGEYINAIRNNRGLKLKDGMLYEGDWSNDKCGMPGKGLFKFVNGDMYFGDWSHDKAIGSGLLKKKDGSEIQIDWKEGPRKVLSSNKNSYKSPTALPQSPSNQQQNYYDNIPDYCGLNRVESMDIDGRENLIRNTSGLFDLGMSESGLNFDSLNHNPVNSIGACGKGTVEYDNGDIYTGEFVDGRRNGHGTLKYSNGDIYEGEWKDGNTSICIGKFTGFNGATFEGQWRDGKMDGHGKMVYANGDKFTGNWKQGMRHGKGVLTYSNGDSFEGEWKDGKTILLLEINYASNDK